MTDQIIINALFMGAFWGIVITATTMYIINEARAKNKYMEGLDDKTYKIVDKFRRL